MKEELLLVINSRIDNVLCGEKGKMKELYDKIVLIESDENIYKLLVDSYSEIIYWALKNINIMLKYFTSEGLKDLFQGAYNYAKKNRRLNPISDNLRKYLKFIKE